MHTNKLYLAISILIIAICLSCESINENDELQFVDEVENEIKETYSTFHSYSENDDPVDAVDLYAKIELYYLYSGMLHGRSKKDYMEFFREYIQKDTIIDLSCLHSSNLKIEMLTSPSNLSNNFYAFEKSFKKNEKLIPLESSLSRAYQPLMKMKSNFDLVFDEEHVSNYLDAIADSDFQNKIIYRIPIIAFSHLLLSERSQKYGRIN